MLAAIVLAALQRASDRNRLFECSIDPAGFVMYDNDGNEMGGLGVVDIERGQGATLAVNVRPPEL